MLKKIVEVLNDSNFKLVEVVKYRFEILAISFKSWGENLYISCETRGNETKMKFCSAARFQIFSWDKNEKKNIPYSWNEEFMNDINRELGLL
ncbi:MAG: hypothetical protein ACI83L_000985 [Cryomorphaceae bacterium]|jgi:hypothetical protein